LKNLKLLDFLLLTDLALILIFTPLSFGAVSNWSQLILFLLITAGGFIWAVKLILSGRIYFVATPLHLPFLIVLLFLFLHALFSPLPYFARREFLLGLSCFIFFLLLTGNLNTRKRLLSFLVLLVVLGILFSGYALLARFKTPGKIYGLGPRQYDHRSQFIAPDLGLGIISRVKPEGYGKRLDAPFICPDHLAGYLEMILPLILALLVISRRSLVKKVLLSTGVLLTLMAFLFTLSRGGWLGLLGGAVFFLIRAASKKIISAKFSFLLGIILLAGIVGIGIGVKPIRERIIRETLHPRISSQIRVVVWGDTLRMVKARPLLGWGLGTFRWIYPRFRSPWLRAEINYAHNDYLHLLAETGVIGLGLFLWLAGAILAVALKTTNRLKEGHSRALVMGASVSIVVILIHSFLDFNLHIPANALLFTAVVSLTVAAGHPERRIIHIRGRALILIILIPAATLIGRLIYKGLQADSFFRKGEQEQAELKWRSARADFSRAAREDPGNPYPWARRGEIWAARGRWARADAGGYFLQAVSHYQKALKLNPCWAEIRAKLGRTLQLRGEMKKARKEFQAALTLDPNNSFYHDLLGMYYRDGGDIKRARSEFIKALKLSPSDSLARRQLKLLPEK
jgi:tetratricopeptide (TPR) repeat protein